MEAVFLVLVGAMLFSQAWHMMGLYSDGRTVGIVVGGLGLLSLAAITLDPMLLTGSGNKTISAANHLSELTVTKMLIAAWAVYGVVVAAQALWDLEERAIAFYSAAAAAVSIVSFFYYAGYLEPRYGESAWLGLSAATLLLSVISAMVFFALGFNFRTLRPVAAWFMLLGGGVVAAIGLAIATRGIA
jgi:hypothetical protein